MLYLNSLHLALIKFWQLKPYPFPSTRIRSLIHNCIDCIDHWTTDSQKIYDYTQSIYRDRYVFETGLENSVGYITANSRIPQQGDYLIVPLGVETVCYQVTAIDRYGNTDRIWTALLTKVTP